MSDVAAELDALRTRVAELEAQLRAVCMHLGLPWDPPGAAPVEDPGGVPPHIVELARAGNKIEAIKDLRELTGLGLKEAKDLIDALT